MSDARAREDASEPWFRVVVSRKEGDKLTRGLADDAASILGAGTGSVVVTDGAEIHPPPDGLFLVVAEDGGDVDEVARMAEVMEKRAIALAIVAEDRTEGSALAHRVRKAFQARKGFVIPRQLVVTRESLGVYGLQDEHAVEKLEGIVEFLRQDADRLLAEREGWEGPDVVPDVEWKGPHVKDREDAERDES